MLSCTLPSVMWAIRRTPYGHRATPNPGQLTHDRSCCFPDEFGWDVGLSYWTSFFPLHTEARNLFLLAGQRGGCFLVSCYHLNHFMLPDLTSVSSKILVMFQLIWCLWVSICFRAVSWSYSEIYHTAVRRRQMLVTISTISCYLVLLLFRAKSMWCFD